MTYSSSRVRNNSLAFPSSIADREFPGEGNNLFAIIIIIAQLFFCLCCYFTDTVTIVTQKPTIEFGLGQDATTDDEAILLIAHIERRDRRVMRYLYMDDA